MNNYEKIKSMPVYEMAEFLNTTIIYHISHCSECPSKPKCGAMCFKSKATKQWLLKECEE